MLTSIARFELRYVLRNPLLLATAAGTFGLLFLSMATGGLELGSEGGLMENAAVATLRNYLMMSLLYMVVTTAFVAHSVIRDDETGFGPIVRATRVTRLDYVLGRFLGAYLAAALCLSVMAPAIWLGSALSWADPADIGPNRIGHHLYGLFLIALPNLLCHSAVLFALATITRSMVATYLGVIGFMFGFFSLQGSFVGTPWLQALAPLADAFGSVALRNAVQFWTLAERNARLPDLAGPLLHNRLLWLGVALAALALAVRTFRFSDEGMSKRERKRREREGREPPAAAGAAAPVTLPGTRHGAAERWATFRTRTVFEAKQVVMSASFPLLMAWGVGITLFALLARRDDYGIAIHATTLALIPELEDAFRVMPLIIAVYHAGDITWRERDRRMHEIVDATPILNWAYVVPKLTAMAIVLFGALTTTVIVSLIVQLASGHGDLELGHHLLLYVLPRTWDMLLLVAVAVFVQAVSPHKAVGWTVMAVFVAWKEWNLVARLVDHNLLFFGGTPKAPLSDFNGIGPFWQGPWTFRVYWGAFALLLLVAAHLLWRRGTETRLAPRLAHARRRLVGPPGVVAGAALVVLAGSGACAYYNTNVLNEYRTTESSDAHAVELERRFGKYRGLPQPMIVAMELDVAMHPHERRAVTRGRCELRNQTAGPIDAIHVRAVDPGLEMRRVEVEGATLEVDDATFGYRIHRLDRPMQPGESRTLAFETEVRARGFRNLQQDVRLVENGMFLGESELMPDIGMSEVGLILDPDTRSAYGLRPLEVPKLGDPAAAATPAGRRGWAHADITVSTSADQTPLAPGNRVSDVVRDGRRTARFTSNAPILPQFAVVSGRYAERHLDHEGIDLAVYYHPAHAWNVDRMLDSMAAALDYYQENFGPYQFDHARIIEIPAYHGFAQAFAGTIPYSEALGFTSDYRDPSQLDYIAGMTAHELAHQYWPHQVIGAQVEGAKVLSETLAQYAASMVVRRTRGEHELRRYRQYELGGYLYGHANATDEAPLVRALGQNHVIYSKGALVMNLLAARLGEDAVNRALRSLLERYKFKGAPHPTPLDLVAAFRAEAVTPQDQQLITDLWERITLYDLKVVAPTAVQRPDGHWEVSVPIEARKLYADGSGAEEEAALDEPVEVGLFTEEPGWRQPEAGHVLALEPRSVRSGSQVMSFVTATKPAFAAVDPYGLYIDRERHDNVAAVD